MYKDDHKTFLLNAINKIDYLKNIPEKTKARIIFNMKLAVFDP